jgi:hypothetical protein
MALTLPPPPTQAEPGTPVWNDWFRRLQLALSSASGVAWGAIDKTGSSLGDLAIRLHSSLTGVQGTGSNHVSSAENAMLTALTASPVITVIQMQSAASDPTTAQIPNTYWAIYKNTTTNAVKLWVNDGGTLKSVALT